MISIGTSLIWEKVTRVGCSWHLSFICCNLIDSLIWRLDEGSEKTPQHPQSLPIYLPLTTVKKSHVSDLLNRNPVNLCMSFNECRQCLPLAIEISQWEFLVLSKTNLKSKPRGLSIKKSSCLSNFDAIDTGNHCFHRIYQFIY